MKRYLAFGGDSYYPGGGWEDFEGAFSTREQAQAAVAHCDWWHVIDAESGKAVAPQSAVEYFERRDLQNKPEST